MKNIKQMKSKEGFTITELLIVLAIAAVIIATAFIAYQSLKSSNGVNSEVQAAASIVSQTRSLYAGQSTYGTGDDAVSNEILINAGAIPANKIIDESTISHSLGGNEQTINIRTSNNSKIFTITYNGVPSDQCAKFVSAIAPTFKHIKIGRAGVKSFNGKLNIDKMTRFCDNGSENNQVDITLASD